APAAPAQPPGRGTPPGGPGLTRGILPGGSTLAFYVADVATGTACEIWHNAPDERTFTTVDNVQWAGDSVLFSRPAEEWSRYYTLLVAGGAKAPTLLPTGDGLIESTSLSNDGKYLYYST